LMDYIGMFYECLLRIWQCLSWQMAVVRVADSKKQKRRYLTREFLHPIKVAVL